MLEICAIQKLKNNNNKLIREVGGAPIRFAHIVLDCLKVSLPGRWRGRAGPIS
jgi:hypothetical protein